MMTSLPLSVRTSSIHFVVCWKEFTSEKANRKSVVSFSRRLLKKCEVNISESDKYFVSPQWNKHWNKQVSVATLAQSTYLWYRKLRLRQQSLWCNLEWGFEIALALQCPTTATWSMEQGGKEEKAYTKFQKKVEMSKKMATKKSDICTNIRWGEWILKKNFYKKWMTPLRVSRQGLEGKRLNQ